MKFCSTCGKQLEDDARFCPGCGARSSIDAESVPSAAPANHRTDGKHLHCPECRGNRLTPIVESTSNGGVAVGIPVTRRTGVTSYSSTTTHRNYWLCQDCGTKFRNLQNLEAELAAESKNVKVASVFCILCTAIGLFFGLLLKAYPELWLFFGLIPVLMAFVVIVLLFTWLISKSKVKKMTEEKEYLEAHCFDL